MPTQRNLGGGKLPHSKSNRLDSTTVPQPSYWLCHVGEFYLSIGQLCRRLPFAKSTRYAGTNRPKMASKSLILGQRDNACGPPHCPGRSASASNFAILCALLQRDQNPSVAKQRSANFSCRSASWNHQITANPRRTSSSLRPDLVFGTDRRFVRQ